MGPEPVLGPGLAVGFLSQDVRDRVIGAPGVRPDRTGQAFHSVPLVNGVASLTTPRVSSEQLRAAGPALLTADSLQPPDEGGCVSRGRLIVDQLVES